MASPPKPEAAPVPIRAEWHREMSYVVVFFDRPLMASPLDPSNWTAKWTRIWRRSIWADANPVRVIATMEFARPGPPGDIVNYAAMPADLYGANGIPVQPFYNFPLIAPWESSATSRGSPAKPDTTATCRFTKQLPNAM